MRQLQKILIAGAISRLIVGGVDDRAAGGVNSVAQASLGMIQITRGDVRAVNLKCFRVGHLAKIARRGHHGYVHWKIRAGELGREDLLEAVRSQIFGLEAVKMEAVLRFEEGMEERDALNVVPMIMRHQ